MPVDAARIISCADMVYLEQFTSPINSQEVTRIQKMSKGQFKMAKRWLVEDGREILESAKKQDTVLLSYGDPYVATTHAELRTRAIGQGIHTHSIHASSSLTSIIGECGLHFYKIGRIATIMSDTKSLTTPYYVLYKNIIDGIHTILPLEYSQDGGFFLDPKDALNGLIQTESGQRRNVLDSSTFAIVASRVGLFNQEIKCGKVSSLLKTEFGSPPHTVIVPGRLHFTEADALRVLCVCMDEPRDNKAEKIPVQMINKYAPMVRQALEEVRPYCKDKHAIILENAELYIRDAEKFLNDGQDEVAVLSIGYADGLVDALRLASGLDPKM